MKKLGTAWYWLKGTVRPISFLVVIPVYLGNRLNGVNDPRVIAKYCILAISMLCFANLYNNFLDRRVDRLNEGKLNLATTDQGVIVWLIMVLIPILGLAIKLVDGYWLVEVSLIAIYSYNQLLVRIPLLKRFVVAGCVASTAFFQPTHNYNVAVWILAVATFVFILVREGKKDLVDSECDRKYKFLTTKDLKGLYWWFLVAPMLGPAIIIFSSIVFKRSLDQSIWIVAPATGIAIWSYIRMRAKYGDYPKKLRNRYYDGMIGLLFAMVVTLRLPLSIAVWIFTVNCGLIVFRMTFCQKTRTHSLAILMDAYLWGSLIIIAGSQNGSPTVWVYSAFVAIVIFVFLREQWRLVIAPSRLPSI